VYQISKPNTPSEPAVNEDAVRNLLNLLGKGGVGSSADPTTRPAWSKRKALVCTPLQYRDSIARNLAGNEYEVYVAEDTRQAVETMRANHMELVLLEPQFDSAEQGGAFVVREINVLRPAQRRRLFFVLISPSLRTMDAHAAFLSNVNCVVNINDLRDLPRILEIALREYNEMYREMNLALSLTSL
jgi:response regulator RpfG family c-di-GMP phosphodiesterase